RRHDGVEERRGSRSGRRTHQRPVADHQVRGVNGHSEPLRLPTERSTERADGGPATQKHRQALSGADNPLVRAVGRIRARVRTKLLAASVGTVVLLVVVGVLGLRVLGGSNARVVRLGTLQLRATAYRELQTDAAQL